MSPSEQVDDVIERMRKECPPIFTGPSLTERSGGVFNWGTIQNRRSAGKTDPTKKIPDECFRYMGKRVLVVRDPFLDWAATTLSVSPISTSGSPPRPARKMAAA